MKLHFLGTGAADWDISLELKDKNHRRFSSLMIDDRLLIDPGPCLFEFEKTFGYDNLYKGIEDIIYTHKHRDHYDLDTIGRLNSNVSDLALGHILETSKHIIYAMAANHGTAKDPKHFLIESKETNTRLFYGLDGSMLPYETYRKLMEFDSIDMMIFDATVGNIKGDYRIFEHNNLTMVKEMAYSFRNLSKRFMISHMARTLHEEHDKLAKDMKAFNIEVAYDNLIIEI